MTVARSTPRSADGWQELSPSKRAGAVLATGLATGLWTGILHTLLLGITRLGMHELVWYSRDFVWMAPIAYSLLLLPIAGLLAVAAFATPNRKVRSLAIVVCVSFGVFGVLLPYTQIWRVAALTLALGAGVWFARATFDHPVAWQARWRRLAWTGVAFVLLTAIAAPIVRRSAERRAVQSLGSADPGAPNVLLLILDTVRAASMSLYGSVEQTTPNLVQWAKQGTTFDWAISAAPWTLPSHASMFTGRYAGGTSADWKKPLDASDSTLAQLLGARGFATAGFVGNMHYTSYDSGLNRGFQHYEDYPVSFEQLWNSTSYTQTTLYSRLRRAHSLHDVWNAVRNHDLTVDMKHRFAPRHASELATNFLRWQEGIHGRPFFAFINFMDAHDRFAPPAYLGKDPTYKHPGYDPAIRYIDDQIDGILRALQLRGMLDNTVVIIAADHGELFNEHGLSGHAHNVYQNVLHVPLVIRYPRRVPAGARIAQTVSLRDMAATIVDLAAVRAKVPGQSLAIRWTNDTAAGSTPLAEVTHAPNVSPVYPTANGPLQSLFDDSLHYIRNRLGKEELYAYRSDTAESNNLANSPATSTALVQWRTRLSGLLTARRDRMLAALKR